MLLIRLIQQHIVATGIFVDTTLETAQTTQSVVRPGIVSRGNDWKPKSLNLPHEKLDEVERVQEFIGMVLVVCNLVVFLLSSMFGLLSW